MPITKTDPTGQASHRQRAAKSLIRRLNNAERRTIALFRSIPRTRHTKVDIVNNEARVFYAYELTATELADLGDAIGRIMADELLTTAPAENEPPFGWYWSPEIEQPYREGSIRELSTLQRDIDIAIAAGLLARPTQTLDATTYLFSEPYRQGLSEALNAGWQSVKAMDERTAAQVNNIVQRGIQAGDKPSDIVNAIRERFDVAESSARRIAVTEVNKAYNDAKMTAGRELANVTGLPTGLLHISALLATTRDHHAARHGNAYTFEAQIQWWNSGANRINCHCTTETVIIGSDGQPVNSALQTQLHGERSFWQSEN